MLEAREMAQPVRADHEDWIHGINMAEENDTRKFLSDLHTHVHVFVHTSTQSILMQQ